MKTATRILLLATLLMGSTPFIFADNASAASSQSQSLRKALSVQVSEIAGSASLSTKAKASLISTAVKTTITAALAGVKDGEEITEIASNYALAAADAAPDFAETIIDATLSIPKVASVKNSEKLISSSVYASLSKEDGSAVASPSTAQERVSPIHEFGGSQSEAIVSPSTLKTKTP